VQHSNVAEEQKPSISPALAEARYADREVLNVDEVAEVLRMEERLVYASIKRDEIPGVRRFGKRGIIRISRRVFFDWLHRRAS
jgi:helix-turn-helix protein